MATDGAKSRTRSGGKLYDFDTDFPECKSFTPSNKLPTYKNVIGMMRHLLKGKGQGGQGVTVNMVCREVAKQVMAKWFHDTVYHKSILSVIKMVKNLHTQYTEGKHRQDRPTSKQYLKFIELFEKKDKLFDIYPGSEEGNDFNRISKCQEEWDGLRMNDRDKVYYEDQKGPRVMVCENKCDPVFYLTWLKHQREIERNEQWKKQKEEQFLYKDVEYIKKTLVEEGALPSASSDDEETTEAPEVEEVAETALGEEETEEKRGGEPPEKKKKKDYETKESTNDSLPDKFQHIRESERKVKPEFYQTCAALTGSGLSIPEAASAIMTVGNKMFEREWKVADLNLETFDNNTTPDDRNIRIALQLQEVEGMARIVEAVEEGRGQGRAITHASDSTTKKGAGQFMVSGNISCYWNIED